MNINNVCFCGEKKDKYQYFLAEKKASFLELSTFLQEQQKP